MSPEARADLSVLLKDEPTLYLDEIADGFAVVHDCTIAIGTLCDAIQSMALTQKRLRKIASERDENLRAAFMSRMRAMYIREQLRFGDESSRSECSLSSSACPMDE